MTLDERVAYLEGRLGDHSDAVAWQFTWLVGIQVAMLVALIGAVLRAS